MGGREQGMRRVARTEAIVHSLSLEPKPNEPGYDMEAQWTPDELRLELQARTAHTLAP